MSAIKKEFKCAYCAMEKKAIIMGNLEPIDCAMDFEKQGRENND